MSNWSSFTPSNQRLLFAANYCHDNGASVLTDSRRLAKQRKYTSARSSLIKANNTFTKHFLLYSTLGNSVSLPATWVSQNNISHRDQLEQKHASVTQISDINANWVKWPLCLERKWSSNIKLCLDVLHYSSLLEKNNVLLWFSVIVKMHLLCSGLKV